MNLSAASPRARFPHEFRTTWVRSTLLAETAGFMVPAATGLVAWRLGVDGLPFVLLLVLAGAGEGAALGAGQAHALESRLPGIRRPWIIATSVAAALAWACGMTPSALIDAGTPTLAVVAIAPVLGLVLLASIGAAQSAVLHSRARASGRWTWMNAIAWLAGLPPTFIIPMLLPGDSAPGVWFAGFVIAGLLMATIVAIITGRFMDQLLTEAGK